MPRMLWEICAETCSICRVSTSSVHRFDLEFVSECEYYMVRHDFHLRRLISPETRWPDPGWHSPSSVDDGASRAAVGPWHDEDRDQGREGRHVLQLHADDFVSSISSETHNAIYTHPSAVHKRDRSETKCLSGSEVAVGS